MIELAVPVEKIPYVRTIEGRKFSNGKWKFPDTAFDVLVKCVNLPPSIVNKMPGSLVGFASSSFDLFP